MKYRLGYLYWLADFDAAPPSLSSMIQLNDAQTIPWKGQSFPVSEEREAYLQ